MSRIDQTSAVLIALFLAMLASLFAFPKLSLAVFLSLLLTLLLSRLMGNLTRRMLRPLAAATAVAVFLVALAVGMTIITGTILPMLDDFIKTLSSPDKALSAPDWVRELPFFTTHIDALLMKLSSLSLSMLQTSLTIAVSAFSRVIDFAIMLILTFYFLKDGIKYQRWIASLFPRRDYYRVLRLQFRSMRMLQAYIESQLSICFVMGLLVLAYYTYRGLPYGPIFALLSAISEFIPVLGPLVASIFGALVMALISPVLGLQTIIFYLVVTQFNHNVMYPVFVGSSLKLHPIFILLGITLGGEVLGPLGMFLAVPLLALGRLFIEDVYKYSRAAKAPASRENTEDCAAEREVASHGRRIEK